MYTTYLGNIRRLDEAEKEKCVNISNMRTSFPTVGELIPSRQLVSSWKSSAQTREDIALFIKQYYEEKLVNLSPEKVWLRYKDSILFCCEKQGFCHRYIISAWIEICTGNIAQELGGEIGRELQEFITEELLKIIKGSGN